MKFLKLKSILFSLMAVAMVTVFLSSCEEDYPQHIEDYIVSEDQYKILSEKFSDYKIVELDVEKIYNEVKTKSIQKQFKLVLSNGTHNPWNLTLARNKVINNKSKGGDENGTKVDISDMITLDGYLNNSTEDMVRLVVTDKLIGGFVNSNGFSYRINPLAEYAHGAKMSDFIIYEENDYKYNDVVESCSLQDDSHSNSDKTGQLNDFVDINSNKRLFAHNLQLRLYTDKAVFDDVSLMFPDAGFADKIKVTKFFVALLVNGASAKFQKSVNLKLEIKSVNVLTTTSFAKGNNVRDLNNLLKDYVNNVGGLRNFQDAVVLISNKRMSGETAGIVDKIGAICKFDNERSYTTIRSHYESGKAYSQPYKENLLAHEIGHLLGAKHPVEKDGDINCGINDGPFPISPDKGKSFNIMWRTGSGSSAASFDNCAKDYMNLHLYFNGSCL